MSLFTIGRSGNMHHVVTQESSLFTWNPLWSNNLDRQLLGSHPTYLHILSEIQGRSCEKLWIQYLLYWLVYKAALKDNNCNLMWLNPFPLTFFLLRGSLGLRYVFLHQLIYVSVSFNTFNIIINYQWDNTWDNCVETCLCIQYVKHDFHLKISVCGTDFQVKSK